MASTKGIRAGRAFVELFADDSKLVRGLRLAQKKLKAFGNHVRNMGMKLAGLGMMIATPLAAAARYFSSYGDQVAKMAKRTGLSVETLSELRFVASQTGTEFASLEMAFRKMQRSIYDAGRGLSTQTDALTDLGLQFKNLKDLSPEAQFKLLADRLGKLTDDTKQAAIAQMLFGRTGTNLIPMFEAGANGISALQKQARKLGLTMSTEDAKAAEDFTDAMDALWKVIKMGVFHIGAALAPAIQRAGKAITEVITKAGQWIKANHGVIVSVAKIAGIVIGVGAALMATGIAISAAAAAIGLLTKAFVLANGAAALFGGVLAWMVTPIGLVITAMGALGGYIAVATGAAGKSLGWLADQFGVLRNYAVEMYNGISAAMANGNLGAAVKIMWLSVKMAWLKGTQSLRTAFEQWRSGFLAAWEIAGSSITKTFLKAMYGLRTAWAHFSAWHRETVESWAGWIAKRIIDVQAIWDDSIDADEQKQWIDQQTEENIAAVRKENKQKLTIAQARIDEERKSALKAADEIHQKNMANIASEGNERIKTAKDAFGKARDEWKKSIAEQIKLRNLSDGKTPAGPAAPPELKDKLGQLQNIAVTLKQERTGGIFNIAAIQSLRGGNSDAARTAKAAEDTAKNTADIKRKMNTTNGPVFS